MDEKRYRRCGEMRVCRIFREFGGEHQGLVKLYLRTD